MDCIRVVDLAVSACHGVLDEEKHNEQVFLVSLDLYLDISESAEKDDLSLSVSYADICKTVKEHMTSRVCNLIETVAEGIAKEILIKYEKIRRVKVILKKPSAPIGEPVKYPAVIIERSWHSVYISVGSNLGESKRYIQEAIESISHHDFIRLKQVSKLIKTKPWGKVDQPAFLNAAFEIETLLSPKKLMNYLLEVEQNFNRKRDEKWGPRTLDLDIIFYDDLISEDPFVVIPHPLMQDRMFVLQVLCEISPYKVHPILKKRVVELRDELSYKTKT
jgi:dihydroneopterin aldolase/2-amino-4-hydroxy-6-hydroxymethyldihydropteridine diphosphokinase